MNKILERGFPWARERDSRPAQRLQGHHSILQARRGPAHLPHGLADDEARVQARKFCRPPREIIARAGSLIREVEEAEGFAEDELLQSARGVEGVERRAKLVPGDDIV